MATYTVQIAVEVEAENEDAAVEEAAAVLATWDSEDVISAVSSIHDFDSEFAGYAG